MCFIYYKNKQKSLLKITKISTQLKKKQAFSEESNDKLGYSVHFSSVH